jgi:signal transduction histidine kinase
MLAGEGLFLGVLLLGSSLLVFRALRREVALARQQANFVAAVTHELRSPIASARLYVDSIRLGRAAGDKQERYLRHAAEDLTRLSKVVDDLLETRRISTTGVDLAPERIDVAALARRVVERHFVVHEHGAQVEVDAPAPAIAEADPAALEKVLDNLISNGLKYGGAQPRVTVAVRSLHDHVLLEVRDHGEGLRGVDPRAVLAPFVRGRDENVREKPGVGLGLYLVDEYVRAHRGRFELADAADGPGAVARVRLPLSPGAPRAPHPSGAPRAPHQSDAPRAPQEPDAPRAGGAA